MSYLEELLPESRKGAKIRRKCWPEFEWVQLKNPEGFVDSYGYKILQKGFLHPEWFLTDDWEFYQEPEIDWDYIIKNNCLCWFWDKVKTQRIARYLTAISECNAPKFIDNTQYCWFNCCPICRDEVTFYEDKNER